MNDQILLEEGERTTDGMGWFPTVLTGYKFIRSRARNRPPRPKLGLGGFQYQYLVPRRAAGHLHSFPLHHNNPSYHGIATIQVRIIPDIMLQYFLQLTV